MNIIFIMVEYVVFYHLSNTTLIIVAITKAPFFGKKIKKSIPSIIRASF